MAFFVVFFLSLSAFPVFQARRREKNPRPSEVFTLLILFSRFLFSSCFLATGNYVLCHCRAQKCRRDMRYVIPITCTNWKPLRLHSIKFTRNEWIATKSHLLKKREKKERMEKSERLWTQRKKKKTKEWKGSPRTENSTKINYANLFPFAFNAVKHPRSTDENHCHMNVGLATTSAHINFGSVPIFFSGIHVWKRRYRPRSAILQWSSRTFIAFSVIWLIRLWYQFTNSTIFPKCFVHSILINFSNLTNNINASKRRKIITDYRVVGVSD